MTLNGLLLNNHIWTITSVSKGIKKKKGSKHEASVTSVCDIVCQVLNGLQ